MAGFPKINIASASEHLNAVRIHEIESGGVTFGIVGSKGSGKTHFLMHLAHQVVFLHPIVKNAVKETVIWRGRPIDYWNYMFYPDFEWENEAFKRRVIVHYWEEDEPCFETEHRERLTIPELRSYSCVTDLYEQIVPGEVNVVYEPSVYLMSPGMLNNIARRSLISEKALTEVELDPCLWWAEFMFYVLNFKKAGFITFILDEIDEIFPAACQSIRWHVQALFADSLKDFRKANISLFFSIHDQTDLDYRIRSKIQFWGYMKGGIPPAGSAVNKAYTMTLPVGDMIIERGTFGHVNLGKLSIRPRVRVSFPRETGNPDLWDYKNVVTTEEGNEVEEGEHPGAEYSVSVLEEALPIPTEGMAESKDQGPCGPELVPVCRIYQRPKLPPVTCPACGYTWVPRVVAPKKCPECQRRLIFEWIDMGPADKSGEEGDITTSNIFDRKY